MQKKVLISLVLLVLLPTGLLAWLGWRMAHSEQKMLAGQVQALISSQLNGVDESINAYFQTVQSDLLKTLSQPDFGDESLHRFSRESPHVKQVLVIGADGKRVLPPPGAVQNQADTLFLQRVSAILQDPGLMTQGAGLPSLAANTGSSASPRPLDRQVGRSSAAAPVGEAGPPQFGWYAWHWNAELHHLFWWRDRQQRLIALELAPAAVWSGVIGRLPVTSPQTPALSTTRLINGSGQTVYEWGGYRPETGERSLAMLPLSHPLGSWKLEYFGPALSGVATANSMGMVAAALVIGSALAGLAIYLYREHRRELDLAQQRVNFVNQVSHELKTPLTNIRLYAELLETELADVLDDMPQHEDVKAHRYLGIITTESQRLSRLIANVLSFGQIQKSEPRLSLQADKVDDLIRRCVAAFQPALDAKGIIVRLEAHADALVWLDLQVLEQILNNLISNVEKYAASGRAIHISSTQQAGWTTIEVRDFGPGIDASERERVFQPFYRVSSRLTDGVAGTGIGLDIARRLARLHGGDVSLCEVTPGACFRVVLRTAAVEEKA